VCIGAAPMSKVVSLNDVSLARPDVEQLLKLALLLPGIIGHDGNACLTVIAGYAELCRALLEPAWAHEKTSPDLTKLDRPLAEIIMAAKRLSRLTALCLGFIHGNKGSQSSQISHVYELFSALAASYPKHDIACGRSSRELRIAYPSPVLYGVLNGLLSNAIRHGSSTTLHLQADWCVAQDRLICNVQDSGVGISSVPPRGMAPRSALELADDGGLELVDRIITGSGGILLFGRSSVLGGLHVHFEIPVLYFSDEDGQE
jgi:K+-sensing histidine kinase KdpD